eukprot:370126-Pyramimonas_sp.AAC.2
MTGGTRLSWLKVKRRWAPRSQKKGPERPDTELESKHQNTKPYHFRQVDNSNPSPHVFVEPGALVGSLEPLEKRQVE